MMQRIINTMFHGSGKAKVFLWSVFIMILATILLGVLAAVMSSVTFLTGAVVCGVATFITSQSVSLRELERKEKKKKAEKEKKDTVFGKEGTSQKISSEQQLEAAQKDEKEKKKIKARYMASMNEKKMKQLLKKHKVRQSHIFVMIDSYPKMQILQTPAVMWKTDNDLHLLVLDGTGREISVPLQDIKGILYVKNVPVNAQEDYVSFQYSNFISKLYKPLLPDYQEVVVDGTLLQRKNLFKINPGISFTNTSMAGVMKILNHVPFLVDDAVNTSDRFNEYFKEIYRHSILCKNGVFSLEEYRQRMEKVLDEMYMAPISGKEFIQCLRELNKYHLITSDYVTKYSQNYIERNQR